MMSTATTTATSMKPIMMVTDNEPDDPFADLPIVTGDDDTSSLPIQQPITPLVSPLEYGTGIKNVQISSSLSLSPTNTATTATTTTKVSETNHDDTTETTVQEDPTEIEETTTSE